MGLQVWLRRVVPVAGCALVLALLTSVTGAGAAGEPGVRVGQPWTGAAGIARTTREIMQRATGGHGVLARPEPEAHLNPRPNPDSPARTPDTTRTGIAPSPKLAVGTSFTGTTLAEEGADGFVPPDSMGAVGPTQFLVTVNGKIKVLSKTGTAGALNTSLDAFFASVISPGTDVHTTDPRVRYDKLSGKWIVTCIDVDFGVASPVDNRVLIAVSDGSTITNSTVWTFFEFQQNLVSSTGDDNDFADFDTLGVDANALYMGTNMFDTSGQYVSSTVFVIRKSSVTGTGPIVVTAFRDVVNGTTGDGPYTPQGVDNDDPSATEGYFVGHDGAFFGKLDVLRVGNPGGTPTLSASLPITVPTDSFPLNVPASGSTEALDGGDFRLTDAMIRNGKLYTAEAIAVNSSGSTTSADRDGARWYEISNLTTTPTLSRSGTIFDSSATKKFFWMPSITVTPQGHAVLGMSSSAASLHANGAFSSMLSGASSFSSPTDYTAATASYNIDTGDGVYRWGDYSHTSVDPCDGQTIWTIQEYVDSQDNWGVKVGKILAPPPATPASASPSSAVTGQASVSVTLTGTSTSGSGFWDPGSGSCRIAASVTGGVTVNSITYTDPTHVTLDLSTVGATGGSKTITITNPDGQTAAAAVFTVATAPQNTALPTISGTPKVGSTLTESDGTWSGTPAPTFTRQWERCDSSGANCTDIAGATSTTYALVQADHGSTIRVRVTATNTAGSASAESAQTAAVQYAPINTAAPTISGTASKGQTLTATTGTWDALPAVSSFAYQWQRCTSPGACSNITGATASTYVLAQADVGLTIRVHVTATNTVGSTGADSAETTAVTAAPANTALPVISGSTQVGATLTTTNGTWTGSPTPSFTYQWERCDSAGANCTDIASATNQTYVLVSADAGNRIRVKVTGTNTVGSATAESAATATITVPPSNDSPPTISGTAAVGQLLTGGDGTWSGSPTPTLTRQWRRCDTGGANCVDIAGATSGTYTLVQADAGSTIRFRVTGSSTSGTTTADSSATAVVTGPPVNTALPTISGTASRGQVLTASTGTWSGYPAPTFAYQWRQCDSGGANCADIGGATSSTYTAVAGDEGKTLRVVVTATNSTTSAAATSNATAVVTGSPQNTAIPVVSGTAAKGSVLTTTNGTWTGYPATFTYTYAWLRCDSGGANCAAIGGATSSSYTPVQADVGGTIESRVTASNGVSPSGSADSAATAIVTGAPANTAAPTITGTTGIGDTLTAHNGTWSGYPAPSFTYQWKRCDSAGDNCSAIGGATASTYVIVAGDAGYRLRVTVTGTNASGSASADSATADVPGPVTDLTAPTITGTAQVGSTLTAHSGSWTGVPAPTFSYQWQRCDAAGANCADIATATAATYQPVNADVGSTLVVEVSGNNGGGAVGPVASAATAAVVAAPSGGGGGGGGGSPPDVVASISATPPTPGLGDTLTYVVQASILTGSATDVVATINLPSQVTLVGATADRGSGCTGTTTLTCDLNFLNGSLVATVRVVTQVKEAGTLVATASLTTTPGDTNTANNTATSTITVSPPPPPPPPPLAAPVLKRVGTAPLRGVRHLRTETVDARFSTNEALRLTATVTRLRSTRKLTMLAKSKLAGTVATSSRTTLRGTARTAARYAVHLVLSRKALVRGKTYVIHLAAVNANGKKTTLSLRFRA